MFSFLNQQTKQYKTNFFLWSDHIFPLFNSFLGTFFISFKKPLIHAKSAPLAQRKEHSCLKQITVLLCVVWLAAVLDEESQNQREQCSNCQQGQTQEV